MADYERNKAPMNIIPAPCDCYVVMSAQQNYIYYLQLCVRVSNVEALHVYIYIYIDDASYVWEVSS